MHYICTIKNESKPANVGNGALAHLARARHWQCRGDRFESDTLHIQVVNYLIVNNFLFLGNLACNNLQNSILESVLPFFVTPVFIKSLKIKVSFDTDETADFPLELYGRFYLKTPKSKRPSVITFIIRFKSKQYKFATHTKVYPQQWNQSLQKAYISPILTNADNLNNSIVNQK